MTDDPILRIAALDLNGQWRGKRLGPGGWAKLEKGLNMPISAQSLDIFGADVATSPLVFASGDADGLVRVTERGPVPLPWLNTPQVMAPGWMFTSDGAPFDGCPRHALDRVCTRVAKRGWQVRCGIEMEFTLVDDSVPVLQPPKDPLSGRPLAAEAILSMRQLDAFDALLSDLMEGAERMGIGVETLISESGIGQFEVTLSHAKAMEAADNAALFKLLARGMARRHGLAATFMAKPYGHDAGNGMHVHTSLTDAQGRNLFDDGGPDGTPLLRHAIAGCLESMPGATLIFAPHGNSYDRFVPGAHAPTTAQWGYDNRTVALRVPSGPPAARRFEHRVPGGDTTPHLVLASILSAALDGIDAQADPPAATDGNAYEQPAPALAPDWETAIAALETDAYAARAFPAEMIDALARTKRQEIERIAALPDGTAWQIWLEAV